MYTEFEYFTFYPFIAYVSAPKKVIEEAQILENSEKKIIETNKGV